MAFDFSALLRPSQRRGSVDDDRTLALVAAATRHRMLAMIDRSPGLISMMVIFSRLRVARQHLRPTSRPARSSGSRAVSVDEAAV